jgi:hypothetical protein
MKINELVNNDIVDFSAIPPQYFLLGLLSAFENRFQAMADKMMGEISWKQFFAIICIQMCKEAPTINDLSDVLGSSHQNVKQILGSGIFDIVDQCAQRHNESLLFFDSIELTIIIPRTAKLVKRLDDIFSKDTFRT